MLRYASQVSHVLLQMSHDMLQSGFLAPCSRMTAAVTAAGFAPSIKKFKVVCEHRKCGRVLPVGVDQRTRSDGLFAPPSCSRPSHAPSDFDMFAPHWFFRQCYGPCISGVNCDNVDVVNLRRVLSLALACSRSSHKCF